MGNQEIVIRGENFKPLFVFVFDMSFDEFEVLRSQIATAKPTTGQNYKKT